MKLLLVTSCFPPFNSPGALRLGKTARRLCEAGHEVRVLTSRRQYSSLGLPLEIPPEWVHATACFDPNPALPHTPAMARAYRSLIHLPDRHIGWYLPALVEGWKILRGWQADCILASSPAYTSLLVGATLSRWFDIPWYAELRDLWTGNHYREARFWPGPFGLRRALDRALESFVLGSARGIIAVSECHQRWLSRHHARPVHLVRNGCDPELVVARPQRPERPFLVTHTGSLRGGRSVLPLLEAVERLGKLRSQLRLRFYGRELGNLAERVDQLAMRDVVEIHPQIPHAEVLQRQRESDVNLLVMWNHPLDDGVIPAKFYQYLTARRPILCLGRSDSEVVRMLTDRGAGWCALEPDELARQLGWWMEGPPLADLPSAITEGLTRQDSVAVLTGLLSREPAETRRKQTR